MAAAIIGARLLVPESRDPVERKVALFRNARFSAANIAVTVLFFALFGFLFLSNAGSPVRAPCIAAAGALVAWRYLPARAEEGTDDEGDAPGYALARTKHPLGG